MSYWWFLTLTTPNICNGLYHIINLDKTIFLGKFSKCVITVNSELCRSWSSDIQKPVYAMVIVKQKKTELINKMCVQREIQELGLWKKIGGKVFPRICKREVMTCKIGQDQSVSEYTQDVVSRGSGLIRGAFIHFHIYDFISKRQ